MISPIRITIKGYPRSESEDFDRRSLIPVSIRISDYPVFYYFGPENPLLFNMDYFYTSSAKMKLNISPRDPSIFNLFYLNADGRAKMLIKGNFDREIFAFNNKLNATSNYFARNGFIKSLWELDLDVKSEILIRAGKISASFGNSARILDCYQVKSNLLRDWDNKTLEEMDGLTNENIAGSIV